MMLRISTTYSPATELGYLLAKHPARVQSFDLSFGKAHTFYTKATAEYCQAALLLDVDPVSLVRLRRWDGYDGELTAYVNDRPYVASSFMSVAIAKVWGSAMNGSSKGKPELTDTLIPLKAEVSTLSCQGNPEFIKNLFCPLGYQVEIQQDLHPYYNVSLTCHSRIADLLTHLYVLLPVLDDDKHYWVDQDEIDKLLEKGAGWLPQHPLAPEIARRYLKNQKHLVHKALEKLQREPIKRTPGSINDIRLETVANLVEKSQVTSCLDLGCGDGKLLSLLMKNPTLNRIAGADVSLRALDSAKSRLNFTKLSPVQKLRLNMFQGSVLYRDERFRSFEIITLIEVIEHLDLDRLPTMEHVLFEQAQPRYIIVTTPNAGYNEKFKSLHPNGMRHADHRFEWNQTEFQTWATAIAQRQGYRVEFMGIGAYDQDLGAQTQLAFFTKLEDGQECEK